MARHRSAVRDKQWRIPSGQQGGSLPKPVTQNFYVRQVNGVKLADILFSLCVCVSVCVHSYLDANILKTV